MHKEQILMLVSRFPFPLEKGDKLRAFYQLKELSEYYDITLVALTDSKVSAEQKEKVARYCASVQIFPISWSSKAFQLLRCFFGKKPFQTGYFYSYKAHRKIKKLIKEHTFSHIYCQLIRTTEYVKNEHSIPKTLDYMDALSAGIQRRIKKQPFYKQWLFKSEANRLINYERHIFDYFENKTIISAQDKELIQHPDKGSIECIPNGIDISFFEELEMKKTHDFVFIGNMSYPPNVEAVHYIAKEILPAFQNATLLISGSSPHSSVVALTQQHKNIELTGWVDDIRMSYARGKIFVAPMMIGTGMQNKLLEAMAMKIPCVTTSLANNAINAKHGSQIMVGNDKDQIIACIKELIDKPQLSEQLANEGSEFVRKNYSWKTSCDSLRLLFKR